MPHHSLGDGPIEPRFRQQMIDVMAVLDETFNPGVRGPARQVGIVLLLFPYGSTEGRANYISNGADRKAIATMLREQAARFEGQPDVSGTA